MVLSTHGAPVQPFPLSVGDEGDILVRRKKNGRECTQREGVQSPRQRGMGLQSVTLLRKAGWDACHSASWKDLCLLRHEWLWGLSVVRALGLRCRPSSVQILLNIQVRGRAWAPVGSNPGAFFDLRKSHYF